ncbi:MAG: glutamine-hydrolyzing GMP synthase [Candidatus Gygaella obscura]|nr:glutamine-hydrolyzing GMP synthase [Candidatus Gygaella obscura]
MTSKDTVLILDFGSQYTQLIARRVRENKVFSKIISYKTPAEEIKDLKPKGLILSGGPASVYDKKPPMPDNKIFKLGIPILGICYGAQVICEVLGGKVKSLKSHEYGKTEIFIDDNTTLFYSLPANISSWMSHADSVVKLPPGFKTMAHSLSTTNAAISNKQKKIFGLQFHPEVVHTQRGTQIINNFVFRVCRCAPRWVMRSLVKKSIEDIRFTVGKKKMVVCGLSGGIDSSVVAALIHRSIGRRLKCIFIDNGLLRKNEAKQVRKVFGEFMRFNLTVVDASKRFLTKLKGVTDPEAKRKIIGEEFIKVFEEKAKTLKNVEYLAQGTLYSDVVESVSAFGGPSAKIKSHHNVGGLPAKMKFKLLEPLRDLFKDEVRLIAKDLKLPDVLIHRQPFPGPGLAIRILGDVTGERLEILREADERVLEEIQKARLYEQIWQSFAILLPIKTVGVMGDERTYENVIALRCVNSLDGMTADWVKLPYDVMEKISLRIINEVKGVNRVVYDISSKPPSTIEWE